MNEERINQIKQALRDLVNQITEIGEEPPDFIQHLLLQVIEKVQNQINELRQLETPTAPQTPSITEAMPSSNVEGFAYDDKTKKLYVRFLGEYPNKNGPVYSYQNVPKVIFDLFRLGSVPARTDGQNKWGKWWKGKVPSIGASLFTLIKNGGYVYNRIS